MKLYKIYDAITSEQNTNEAFRSNLPTIEQYRANRKSTMFVDVWALEKNDPVRFALLRIDVLWTDLSKRYKSEQLSEYFLEDRKHLKEVERNLQARLSEDFPEFPLTLAEFKKSKGYSYKNFK